VSLGFYDQAAMGSPRVDAARFYDEYVPRSDLPESKEIVPEMGQLKELWGQIWGEAQKEVDKLATRAGESIATPVVSQAEEQWKAKLPWFIIGGIVIMAVGGWWGALAHRARRR
jgi:hypothetical protein